MYQSLISRHATSDYQRSRYQKSVPLVDAAYAGFFAATSGVPPARLAPSLACVGATCDYTQHDTCTAKSRRRSPSASQVTSLTAPVARQCFMYAHPSIEHVPDKRSRKIGNFALARRIGLQCPRPHQIKTPRTLIAIVVSPPTALARPRLDSERRSFRAPCIGSLRPHLPPNSVESEPIQMPTTTPVDRQCDLRVLMQLGCYGPAPTCQFYANGKCLRVPVGPSPRRSMSIISCVIRSMV